jgi:hypothetical protein
MAQRFLDYERANNRLLSELQHGKAFGAVRQWLVEHSPGVVVVPQSVTLERVTITRELMEQHVGALNPANRAQIVFVNGSCATLTDERDKLLVLQGPPSDAGMFAHFQSGANVAAEFAAHPAFERQASGAGAGAAAVAAPLVTALVLRESVLELDKRADVAMLIVSDPIEIARPQASNEQAEQDERRLLGIVNIHDFMERLQDPRAADVRARLQVFITSFLRDERQAEQLAHVARNFMVRACVHACVRACVRTTAFLHWRCG